MSIAPTSTISVLTRAFSAAMLLASIGLTAGCETTQETRPSNFTQDHNIDSEFAAFLHRAEEDPASLSPEEQVRWDAYMTAVFRHFGNLVYQLRVGALDRQMWESYERTLQNHLEKPSWVDWFQAHEFLFSSSLIEQVERARPVGGAST